MNSANDNASGDGKQTRNFYKTLESFIEKNQTLPPSAVYEKHPLHTELYKKLLSKISACELTWYQRDKDFLSLWAEGTASTILRGITTENKTLLYNGSTVDEVRRDLHNLKRGKNSRTAFNFEIVAHEIIIDVMREGNFKFVPPHRVAA